MQIYKRAVYPIYIGNFFKYQNVIENLVQYIYKVLANVNHVEFFIHFIHSNSIFL